MGVRFLHKAWSVNHRVLRVSPNLGNYRKQLFRAQPSDVSQVAADNLETNPHQPVGLGLAFGYGVPEIPPYGQPPLLGIMA
jgi:hypothetical protein